MHPAAAGALAVIYGTGVYVGLMVQSVRKLPLPPSDIADPKAQRHEGPKQWDTLAPEYNGEVGTTEFLLGMSSMRRFLVSKARGRTLEVSAGTGRNTRFYSYNHQITSLVFTDESLGMLNEAYAEYTRLVRAAIPIARDAEFTAMSAEQLQYEDNSFDSVVDTFGLCSVRDPVRALNEMARVCRPDGTILLLEHGRPPTTGVTGGGISGWILATVASTLDRTASPHFDKFGCWWNRDIHGIVESSALDVVEKRTQHFGMTHWFVARPNKELLQKALLLDQTCETAVDKGTRRRSTLEFLTFGLFSSSSPK